MDFNQVKELIKMIDSSSLSECELRLGDSYIKLNKASGGTGKETKAIANKIMDNTTSFDEPMTILPEIKKEVKEGIVIQSQIVGTFYTTPSPDKPAFVSVGDKVKAGDILCIIEAMKVMNEITAKESGTIAEIMAENEQMVEYGQPLFRIV